ncbi:MAG: protein LphB [Legionella sp.]|jgi:hypothetical protein
MCTTKKLGLGIGYFVMGLILIYLFFLQVQAIWSFTVDDAYISLRYAKHWFAGEGLVWNLYEHPVEGYSNFSFVALGALALFLHWEPMFCLKVAGFFGLFFTCVFVYLITRFWFARRESLLPCIGLLLYKGQIIWAVSGLETTVYEALICGSVYFCFKGLGYQHYPATRLELKKLPLFLAGLLLAIAGMTRPEAPVLMAVFFLLLLWNVNDPRLVRRILSLLYYLIPILALYLPYFLWRWNYFGHLVPNSINCKAMTGENSWLLDINYLKLIWPFALLSLPALIKAQDRRLYFLWVPSLVYLILLIGADPIVAFDNRLFLPALALMYPLVLLGINTLIELIKAPLIILYVAYFYFALLFIPFANIENYRFFTEIPVAGEQLRDKLGLWLQEHKNKIGSVVLSDAGKIPYTSEFHFIDSYCLNNATMGQYPAKQKYELFCEQMLSEKPSIIILTSLHSKGIITYAPSDICLKKMLKADKDYRLFETFILNNPNSSYKYEVFYRQSAH